MLLKCSSEISSFNRYMLPGIANKTDQRSMLFRYPQQFVAGPVGQQSPFVNGNNGVLKPRSFLRSEQKRCDCLYLPLWDFALERLDRFRRRRQEDVTFSRSNHSSVKLFERSGFSGAGNAAQGKDLVS